MAMKFAYKAKNAYIQFSKRMCASIAVFWMAYRLMTALLVFFRPDISTAMIRLTEGVDTVMIANISVYTGNSVSEKAFIAFGKNKKNDDDVDDDDKSQDDNNKNG